MSMYESGRVQLFSAESLTSDPFFFQAAEEREKEDQKKQEE